MADETLTIRATLHNEIAGPARAAKAELAGVREEVNRTNAASSSAASGGTAKLRAGLNDVEGSGGKLRRTLEGLSGHLTGAFLSALRMTAIGLGAVTIAAGVFGLKAASNFQQTRVAFDTMLGSVEQGGALFKSLQDLNLKSPFELGQITQATQVLLRYGVAAQDVVGVTKGIANAAALSGPAAAENLQRMALALGQVQAKGHLAGEEARQLAEAGINAYLPYMKVLGLTRDEVEKLGEQGKLTGNILLDAVARGDVGINGMNEAAEKLSLTLGGQFSNLKDLLSVGLSDAAGPLVKTLSTIIGTPDHPGALVAGITGLVQTAGPPIFDLLGHIATLVSSALPSLAPILTALATGAGRILDALGPGLAGLAPVADDMGSALVELVDALAPEMPQLADAFVQLAKVAPEFVRLLADVVPLVDPMLRLMAGLLGLGPVRVMMADLLFVLLGYRALNAVADVIRGLAGSFRGLAAAEEAETAAAGAGAGARGMPGLPGGVNRALPLGMAAVPLFADAAKHKGTARSDAEFIGGMGLTGAAIGSVVPGVGTLIGGAVGLGAGGLADLAGHLFAGDTATPRGSGSLAGTLDGHAYIDALVPGQRYITNALYGAAGDSDHRAGRALDLVGSGLLGYAAKVRDAGGYADMHGSGPTRHLHAVYGDTVTPRRRSSGGPDDRGGLLVQVMPGGSLVRVDRATADVDVQAAVEAGLREAERARRERS